MKSPLQAALNAKRAEFAKAAQKILDGWEQDENGEDCELGTGGPCDRVAQALADVLTTVKYRDQAGKLRSPDWIDGGQPGDDHAWLIVYDDHEAFALDIPSGVYETGGGYTWRKRPGVRVRAADVSIEPVVRSDIEPADDSW